MNATTIKFGLLAVMFGVAVVITLMAFFPEEAERAPRPDGERTENPVDPPPEAEPDREDPVEGE